MEIEKQIMTGMATDATDSHIAIMEREKQNMTDMAGEDTDLTVAILETEKRMTDMAANTTDSPIAIMERYLERFKSIPYDESLEDLAKVCQRVLEDGEASWLTKYNIKERAVRTIIWQEKIEAYVEEILDFLVDHELICFVDPDITHDGMYGVNPFTAPIIRSMNNDKENRALWLSGPSFDQGCLGITWDVAYRRLAEVLAFNQLFCEWAFDAKNIEAAILGYIDGISVV